MNNIKLSASQAVSGLAFGIVAAAALSWFFYLADKPVPSSLKDAGLAAPVAWSPAQLRMAADVTKSQLVRIAKDLDAADRTGDRAAAIALFDPLGDLMRIWNEQSARGATDGHTACTLAAAHLSDGVQAVAFGGRFEETSRSRYKASFDSCKP
jgi:hypothetical protein